MFPYICVVIGLIAGSFLNVVIRRYPVMLRQQIAEFQGETQNVQPGINLIRPRSHCPHCRKSIRIRDNIPLVSWLILKGRCRDCHGKISLRYPLVELLTALSFLLAGLAWPDSGWGVAVMILSVWLIAASFIDLEHQWLPDIFTQGVLWTGLIVAWGGLSPLPLHDAVSGGLAGFVSFYTLRWLAGVVLRREALGMGDVLLFAGLGSWTGPLLLPDVALVASFCALIYAITTGKYANTVPFGPFLSLGGMVTLYTGIDVML